ncbi:hypothetical protein [Streptomyces sp. NPDC001100]
MIASAVSLLSLPGTPAEAATTSDSEVVFCLSRENRKDLVDAGIALGVLSESSTVKTLQASRQEFSGNDAIGSWRKKQPVNFRKVCRALVDSAALSQGNSPKEESSFPFLSWLLPIIIGSLLTMFAAEAQGARARKLTAAEELRIAVSTFRDALNQYVSEWLESSAGGKPSTAIIDQRRMQFIATLRKAGLRGTWPFVERLVGELEGPRYGKDLDLGWAGSQDDTRLRAERVRSHLSRLEADAEKVASSVASFFPIWLRPSRKKTPSSVSP